MNYDGSPHPPELRMAFLFSPLGPFVCLCFGCSPLWAHGTRPQIREPEKVQKCDKHGKGARDSNEQLKEIAEQPILFISDLIAFR